MPFAPGSLLLVLLPVLPLAGASPAAGKFDGLLRNSPFGQPAVNAATGNGSRDALEFRSMVVQDGRTYFSIYDPATRRSAWVGLNDAVDGLLVRGYDAARESIAVTYQGSPVTLILKRSVLLAQATAPVAPVVATATAPAILPATGASTDQQRQVVMAELRRRRAVREQAVTQTR